MPLWTTRAGLAALPRAFVPDAIAGLDMATDAGRSAARLRMATSLARNLKASTLVASCRANGIRHITTGVAAAHALASISIPEDQLRTAPS